MEEIDETIGIFERNCGFIFDTVVFNLNYLTWYIDGSYALHEDMRGQSGAMLLAGDCAVLFQSNKQKVNTRSSTKTELVAVDDALPTIQWTKQFMYDQGYDLETIIKEDN